MLTVTGTWISQFEVKNGNLASSGIIEKRQNDVGRTQEYVCIDWYLVTTIRWDDGPTTTTEEYIETTCYEECGGDLGTVCDEIGGGGGVGGELDLEYFEEVPIEGSFTAPHPTALIPVAYHATITKGVKYFPLPYITYVKGNKPWPVPVSQPFKDAAGNPAMLYNSVGSWLTLPRRVTASWWQVHYEIEGIYLFSYTTGTIDERRQRKLMKNVYAW